jgi:membrane-bound lytic murein transglycosylase A
MRIRTDANVTSSPQLFGFLASRFRLFGVFCGSLLLASCSSTPEASQPQYDRPLRQGEQALRKIDARQVRPLLVEAYSAQEDGLAGSLERSSSWYAKPSSASKFPFRTQGEDISHERARQSVQELKTILTETGSADEFADRVLERFDVYQTVGWDNQGTVLFTGYYAPIFKGSLEPGPEFTHPLHRRPEWLLSSPEGVPFGMRSEDGRIIDSPHRTELEGSGMLEGHELVWLPNRLDAYICQVNGSARIELPDGRVIHVGYAGKTEHPYTGLGESMLREGLIPEEGLSLKAIQAYYEREPHVVNRLIDRNASYVFFTDYDGAGWPAGSLGVPVTTRASIATDKSVYPPGAVALVDTRAFQSDGSRQRFVRLVCDQDTGGAIVAPGRCDLFMGIGPQARVLAGGQYSEGTMYYIFRKPDAMASYTE